MGAWQAYSLAEPQANVDAMVEQIAARIRRDRDYGELVARWLADSGIEPSRDPDDDARVFAVLMSKRPEGEADKVMNATGELLGIAALTGLAIAGIFEPTPVLDGASVVVALGMMRYSGWYFVDAALSGVSLIPYVGDAVAKPILLAHLTARVKRIVTVLDRLAGTVGRHVKVAIEALRRRQSIPRLPPGASAVMVRAASTGSRHLDSALEAIAKSPASPYKNMERFKAYMKRRGVEVADGERGARLLDKMGEGEDTKGMFMTFTHPTTGATHQAFLFRGHPDRSLVHHELWHRNDFLRNYGGDLERWAQARSIDKERYVHRRMTGAGSTGMTRGQARWNSYSPREQLSQRVYQHYLEKEYVLEELARLGLDPP